MSKQLIIAGFHRSGTSMLAQELHNAGLFLGEHLMDPSISNADGHFEDMEFFRLHEKILKENNTTASFSENKILNIPTCHKKEMKRIVSSRNSRYDEWGFKDPRTALFLKEWMGILDDPYVVVIYRHYESCANSLLHRAAGEMAYGNGIDTSFWEDPELTYRMWLTYNKKILEHIENYPDKTIVVSHKAILEGYPIIKTIKERFDFALDVNAKSSIKHELVTSETISGFNGLSSGLKRELDEVWERLENLSLAPSNSTPIRENARTDVSISDIFDTLKSLDISTEDKRPLLYQLGNSLLNETIELEQRIASIWQRRMEFMQAGMIYYLIDIFKTLLVRHPLEIDLYHKLSILYQSTGEYRQQEEILLQMFSVTEPSQIRPYYSELLANCYLMQENFPKAHFYIDRAIKGNPRNPSFYRTKANIYYRECRYDDMWEQIEKSIEATQNDRQYIVCSLEKIDKLIIFGEMDKAFEALKALQVKFPKDENIKKRFSIFETEKKIIQREYLEDVLLRIKNDSYYFTKLLRAYEEIDKVSGKMDFVLRVKKHFEKIKSTVENNNYLSFKEIEIDNAQLNQVDNTETIKTLYILWLQGFENAPKLVKKCVASWVDKNPTWNIVLLDEVSLREYVDIDDIIDNKTITNASLSDIIRIKLLKKYGGLWVDATTYCTIPLDDWLHRYIKNGFFAFSFEKNSDRLIASWFLYGQKDNYIIDKWHKAVLDYCQKTSIIGNVKPHSSKERWTKGDLENHYFWFHYLFEDLYQSNPKFKTIWDNIPKLLEKDPHYIQRFGMLSPLAKEVKEHIDFKKSPLYKLTYRYDEDKYNEDCNLYYLIKN